MTQYTGLGGWVTNNPDVAKQLRAADHRYEVAKIRAAGLPLGQKVERYREAKQVRDREYDAIFANEEALQ
jgi:hypothetical protein